MKGSEEVAKERTLTPAEKLAADIKANGVKKGRTEGPKYYFPQNTLKKEREKLGLKVNQAATGCGVSHLGECEKGCNTNLASAARIAMFYGKSIEVLFGTPVLDDRPALVVITQEMVDESDRKSRAIMEGRVPTDEMFEDEPVNNDAQKL